jgi:PBSX family phage terminase large subunit
MAAIKGMQLAEAGHLGVIVFARQFYNSLADSSFFEVSACIQETPFLAAYYDVGKEVIRTKNGRISFSFIGLARNISGVKSKARVFLTWIDEAEDLTQDALDDLIPTIKRESQSELWVTWNPKDENSPIDNYLRKNPPENSMVVSVNWSDNKLFPAGLEEVRQYDLKNKPKQYEHIWEGGYKTSGGGEELNRNWFVRHEGYEPEQVRMMNKYIIVDPARTKNENSDYTSMILVGLNHDNHRYVLDMVRDKLNLSERWEAMRRMHIKWKPQNVYYKKTGAEAEIEAFQLFMHDSQYRFKITSLVESANAESKVGRIRRIIPDLQSGRWLFPKTAYKLTWDGNDTDQMAQFITQEVMSFPYAKHDDMLDALSGAYDIAEVWPSGATELQYSYLRQSVHNHLPDLPG